MHKIKIGCIVLGMAQTNCYYVYREKAALVFDPADKGQLIYDKLKEKGLEVCAIFLTHGHFDHMAGAEELKDLTGAKIYALDLEAALCADERQNVSDLFGRPTKIEADIYLKDGAKLDMAGLSFELIATPGHTAGSVCYHFPAEKVLISGDTLFQYSVGRSDFPTGNANLLVRSIREKLFVLPDDTIVYPGHGELTEIGAEKRSNPFT